MYVSSVNQKDKNLIKLMADYGVTFVKNGFKIWCEKFSEYISRERPKIFPIDLYRDAEGRLFHSCYKDIASKAADPLGILERLGINFSETTDDSFLRLTLMLYGVCGKMFVVLRGMGVTPIAKLAVVYPEHSAALKDLRSMFCSDSNGLEKSIKKSFDRYKIMLEQDTETISVRHLIALMMAMVEVYLPRLGVPGEKRITVLQGYCKYLTGGAGSASVVTERFKMFLLSLRDIPIKPHSSDHLPKDNVIYAKDDKLLFLRSTFDHTAKKCGTTRTALVDILAGNDILQGGLGGYMHNIRFGSETQRMYAVKASSLFAPGELRPMYVNESEPKPLYKLPL